jgi:hypothetical protein
VFCDFKAILRIIEAELSLLTDRIDDK